MDDIRDAEQALVAALVLSPERQRDVDGWLTGADFRSPVCGLIFDRLAELRRADDTADAQQLLAALRDRGELRRDGYPVSALVRWFDKVPPRPHVAAFGALVVEGQLACQVEAAGIRLVQSASRGGPARALAAAAAQRAMLAAGRRRWCALPHHAREATAPYDAAGAPRSRAGAPGRGWRAAPAAELAVVGSLIFAPHFASRMAAWLRPEDFLDRRLATAFDAAVAMAARGAPVDRITVTAELHRTAPRADWGRLLGEAEATAPVPMSAGFYARQVLDAAVVRAVDSAGWRLVRFGRARPGGAVRMLDSALAELDFLEPIARRLRRSRVVAAPRRTPAMTRPMVRTADAALARPAR